MGPWFKQILIEGGVVALVVTIMVVFPLWPVLSFGGALLFMIALRIFRDPRGFYRRMFHLVVAALLVPPGAHLVLKFVGQGEELAQQQGEPSLAGALSLLLEIGGGTNGLLLFGLAVVCVIADLISNVAPRFFAGGAVDQVKITAAADSFRMVVGTGNSVDGAGTLAVNNPLERPLRVNGAHVKLFALLPVTVPCDLFVNDSSHPGAPKVPVNDNRPAEVEKDKQISMTITFSKLDFSSKSFVPWRLWFGSRLGTPRLRGELILRSNHSAWQEPFALRLKILPRSATRTTEESDGAAARATGAKLGAD